MDQFFAKMDQFFAKIKVKAFNVLESLLINLSAYVLQPLARVVGWVLRLPLRVVGWTTRQIVKLFNRLPWYGKTVVIGGIGFVVLGPSQFDVQIPYTNTKVRPLNVLDIQFQNQLTAEQVALDRVYGQPLRMNNVHEWEQQTE